MAHTINTQQAVEAWKVAHRFVLDVYKLTKHLPAEEHYGLTPKVRASAVKIASNIVEGYARKSNDFYARHLAESQVALEETKYSLLVARDLGYVADSQYDRIMRDAEHLSELLNELNRQLALAPAQPETSRASGAFAVSKGFRESLREAWDWLKGGDRQKRREPQVWVEENPAYHYLEDGSRD